VDIQHEYTSETLGVTVRFHKPLRGRHYEAYQAVIRAADRDKASDTATLFAAALTLIDEWESADGQYPHPAQLDFDDADFSLVFWLGQVGATYVREVRAVPFRSLDGRRAAPEARTALPPN